jgi:predicted nucleic acid-binding protein
VTTYYLDTSALIKRYVDETGSDWLQTQIDAQPPPTLVIVHLAIVEMTSALARRMREGVLNPEEYHQLQNAFRFDCLTDYEIVFAAGAVIDQANQLLEQHPLRAYDAVHLATAMVTNQQLLANNLAPLIFLSVDERLNQAAAAKGLAVVNPNDHP